MVYKKQAWAGAVAQQPSPPSSRGMRTGLGVQGAVVVDVGVTQRPAGHRVAAHADGRHRADLRPMTDTARDMVPVAERRVANHHCSPSRGSYGAAGIQDGTLQLLCRSKQPQMAAQATGSHCMRLQTHRHPPGIGSTGTGGGPEGTRRLMIVVTCENSSKSCASLTSRSMSPTYRLELCTVGAAVSEAPSYAAKKESGTDFLEHSERTADGTV